MSQRPEAIPFLSMQDVLHIHDNSAAHEGGAGGVRDVGLLESGVAMPQQTFDGHVLHPDIPAQAAAYWFRVVNKHPFVDGNKRAGLQAFQIFLAVNGFTQPEPRAGLAITFGIARGELTKAQVSQWLRASVHPLK